MIAGYILRRFIYRPLTKGGPAALSRYWRVRVEPDEKLPEGERQETIEAAWYREIERRASELDSGTAQTIPWKLVRARLRALRNCRQEAF